MRQVVSEDTKASKTKNNTVVRTDEQHEVKKIRMTKQQLALLGFIWKFRYVTTKQVQQYLKVSHIQQAQQRLDTLVKKQYIGRRYSHEDRLLGRYATYFFLPKGLTLMESYGTHPKPTRLMRKDATASWRFLEHSLAIGDVTYELGRLYRPQLLGQYPCTKNNLYSILSSLFPSDNPDEILTDSFPRPLPDLFVTGIDFETPRLFAHFFVEVWHDTVPFWVYKNRIDKLIDYVYEDHWRGFMKTPTPAFLIVCDSPTLQKRVQRCLIEYCDAMMHDSIFLVTNRPLLKKTTTDEKIWVLVQDEQCTATRLSDTLTRTTPVALEQQLTD